MEEETRIVTGDEESQNMAISENIVIETLDTPVSISETTSRFSGAPWYTEMLKVSATLAGVGGIGSHLAFMLGRLGITSLTLYDDDTIEASNLSGQLYSIKDIGNTKVSTMFQFLAEYTDIKSVISYVDKFTEDDIASEITLCGFDNMVARKLLFRKWLETVENSSNKNKCIFIDGRLAAEEFQIFCIKGSDTEMIQVYKDKYLFSDSQAEITLCSYKQTTYAASMIAAYMANLLVNFISLEYSGCYRDLPFLVSYDASLMVFNTDKYE